MSSSWERLFESDIESKIQAKDNALTGKYGNFLKYYFNLISDMEDIYSKMLNLCSKYELRTAKIETSQKVNMISKADSKKLIYSQFTKNLKVEKKEEKVDKKIKPVIEKDVKPVARKRGRPPTIKKVLPDKIIPSYAKKNTTKSSS